MVQLTPLSRSLPSTIPLSLYTWGKGPLGSLGTGNITNQAFPTRVNLKVPGKTHPGFPLNNASIQTVDFGLTHSAAITDGHLFMFGCPKYDKLGVDYEAFDEEEKCMPHLVNIDGKKIVDVSCGDFHSAAVTSEGEVYTWGWGGSFFSGQGGLGHGNKKSVKTPTKVEGIPEKIISVKCGKAHTYALSEDGNVFTWGKGEYGIHGNGKNSDLSVPTFMHTLEGHKIVKIDSGPKHGAALTQNGELFMWGVNDHFQISVDHGVNIDAFSMELVPVLIEKSLRTPTKTHNIVDVSTSVRHTVAVTDEGKLFFWGDSNVYEPRDLSEKFDDVPIDRIATGVKFSLALDVNGEVYSWGSNAVCLGGAGNSATVSKSPQKVQALSKRKVVDVRAGYAHAAALVDES